MANLVALAATPGAFAPGSVLHLWHNGTTLCGSVQFRAGAEARLRLLGGAYEWPGVGDPRPLCCYCRRSLDQLSNLAGLHIRIHQETDRG